MRISPMRWDEFIGRPANRDHQVDELIDGYVQGLSISWEFNLPLSGHHGTPTAIQRMWTTQGYLV